MGLSFEEALQRLQDIPATKEALLNLVEQVSVESSGSVTVLYSGELTNDVSSTNLITDMLENNADIRVIDKTPASRLLQSNKFLAKAGQIEGLSLEEMQEMSFKHPIKDWLFDATEGPWAKTSERFVEATTGEVRTLVPHLDPSRVFAQTELPALLANDNITTVDGFTPSQLTMNADPAQFGEGIADRVQSDDSQGYDEHFSQQLDAYDNYLWVNQSYLSKSFLSNHLI